MKIYITLFILLMGVLQANPWDDAYKAYFAKDYKGTMLHISPIAEKGDALAQTLWGWADLKQTFEKDTPKPRKGKNAIFVARWYEKHGDDEKAAGLYRAAIKDNIELASKLLAEISFSEEEVIEESTQKLDDLIATVEEPSEESGEGKSIQGIKLGETRMSVLWKLKENGSSLNPNDVYNIGFPQNYFFENDIFFTGSLSDSEESSIADVEVHFKDGMVNEIIIWHQGLELGKAKQLSRKYFRLEKDSLRQLEYIRVPNSFSSKNDEKTMLKVVYAKVNS